MPQIVDDLLLVNEGININLVNTNTQVYLSGSDLTFKDANAGIKTLSELSSGVTWGTATNNYVVFGSDSGDIESSSNFTFDGTDATLSMDSTFNFGSIAFIKAQTTPTQFEIGTSGSNRPIHITTVDSYIYLNPGGSNNIFMGNSIELDPHNTSIKFKNFDNASIIGANGQGGGDESGRSITIRGGESVVNSNLNGGDILIYGGAGDGTGSRGNIYFGDGSLNGYLPIKGSETNIVYYDTATGKLSYGSFGSGDVSWGTATNDYVVLGSASGDIESSSSLYYDSTYGLVSHDASGTVAFTAYNTTTTGSGSLLFRGKNSINDDHSYAIINGKTENATDGSEEGSIEFALSSYGSTLAVTYFFKHDMFSIGTDIEISYLNNFYYDLAHNAWISADSSGNLMFRDASNTTEVSLSSLVTGGGGISNISEANDVTISSVTDGELLVYDNGTSDWINQTLTEAGISAIGHSHNTLSTGTGLTGGPYDGTSNITFSLSASLEDLNDVTMAATDDNDILQYQSGTAQWENVSLATAGIASSTHTHGDISNSGTISSTAITPSSGDYILLSDSSSSGAIKRGISVGTSTTTFLRNDGSWATPPSGPNYGTNQYLIPISTSSSFTYSTHLEYNYTNSKLTLGSGGDAVMQLNANASTNDSYIQYAQNGTVAAVAGWDDSVSGFRIESKSSFGSNDITYYQDETNARHRFSVGDNSDTLDYNSVGSSGSTAAGYNGIISMNYTGQLSMSNGYYSGLSMIVASSHNAYGQFYVVGTGSQHDSKFAWILRNSTGTFRNVMELSSSGDLELYGGITANLSSTAGLAYVRYDTTSDILSYSTSDIRLKKNIEDWDYDSLSLMRNLPIKIFDRKDGSSKGEIGWIAQDIEKVDPNMVMYDRYNNMIIKEPIFMQHFHRGIVQLDNRVETNEDKIKRLEEEILGLKKRIKELQ